MRQRTKDVNYVAALLLALAAFVAVKAYWWDRPRPLDRLPKGPAPVLAPEGGLAEGGVPH